ncbi:MAG: exopolysaccharide Pel transporter PelG [bacterium]|nr:exopolysaccharide Pel transporter PelG [bacterium]
MAGIGFELRRVCLEEAGTYARVRAYATAGLVAAGPWLVTLASLWFVRLMAGQLGFADVDRFFALVSVVFAASLVTTGGLQMAGTRWLADQLYVGEHGVLVPAFSRLFGVVAAVQAVTAAGLGAWCGVEFAVLAPLVVLYVAVSLAWLAFVWLSLVRQHDRILWTFLGGGAVFAGTLLLVGPGADLVRLLWIYALSNALVVAAMVVLIVRGTEAATAEHEPRLRGLLQRPSLWWIGTGYALSLWIDKVVFWFGDGVRHGGVPSHPLYDTCFYLAYLTVVPAMAVNLVHLETGFYERYRGFYAAIEQRATLADIRERAAGLRASLERSAGALLRVQGAFTFFAFWFAPELAAAFGLPEFAGHTLRLAVIGAFCHVLLLLTVLVLLYFDRRLAASRTVGVFLVLNALLACASLYAGPSTYGLGYGLAALAALMWGVLELRTTLARLDYVTFVRR